MTKIAWTEKSWNPVVGCTKVSPGCDNCYAERMARRLKGMCLANNSCPQYLGVVDENGWTGRTECCDWLLDKPLHWRKPRKIFVCSMGDLFHPSVPFEFIDRIHAAMLMAYRKGYFHTYQILTKRPNRMLKYYSKNRRKQLFRILEKDYGEITGFYGITKWPLTNCWLGVTAENQEMADKRIPILLQIPAAVRFVSIEPMLGLVDIKRYLAYPSQRCSSRIRNEPPVRGIDWVIVGAESGPKRRFCEPNWVESIETQCFHASTPLFVKQIHGVSDGKLIKNPPGWPREYPK